MGSFLSMLNYYLALLPIIFIGAMAIIILAIFDETRPYVIAFAIFVGIIVTIIIVIRIIVLVKQVQFLLSENKSTVKHNVFNKYNNEQNIHGLLYIPRLIKIVQIQDRFYVSIRNKSLKRELGIDENKIVWNRLIGGLTDKERSNSRKQTELDLTYLSLCKTYKSDSISAFKQYLDDLPFSPRTKEVLEKHVNSNY